MTPDTIACQRHHQDCQDFPHNGEAEVPCTMLVAVTPQAWPTAYTVEQAVSSVQHPPQRQSCDGQ